MTKLLKNSKGQGLAEYALILGLIAVVCIGVLGTLGQNAKTGVNKINVAMGSALGILAPSSGGPVASDPNIKPGEVDPGNPCGNAADCAISVGVDPGKVDPINNTDPAIGIVGSDPNIKVDPTAKVDPTTKTGHNQTDPGIVHNWIVAAE